MASMGGKAWAIGSKTRWLWFREQDRAARGWGNGKATAVLFTREGAKVLAADLKPDAAVETKRIIESEGGICMAVAGDVSRAGSTTTPSGRTEQPRQPAASRLRHAQRPRIATGRDAAHNRGLRAPSRCSIEPGRLKWPTDSTHPWMRNGAQVRAQVSPSTLIQRIMNNWEHGAVSSAEPRVETCRAEFSRLLGCLELIRKGGNHA
jgi:hypothetical protein